MLAQSLQKIYIKPIHLGLQFTSTKKGKQTNYYNRQKDTRAGVGYKYNCRFSVNTDTKKVFKNVSKNTPTDTNNVTD